MIVVLLRACVSTGVGVATITGVWVGLGATGVGVGVVRGGFLTGGFLTVMDEATFCPVTSPGCVEGCFGVARRVRPVPRRVGCSTALF